MTEIFRKPDVIVINDKIYYTAFDDEHTFTDILLYLLECGGAKEELIDILKSL